jgi:SAM-dependent methyltransferase
MRDVSSLPFMSDEQFDFGKNWQAFSRHALTAQRVEQARRDFMKLLEGIELKNQSFLDIGFGQGLSLLTAKALGACALGCDINPLCADVFAENKRRHFPELNDAQIPVVVGSILDATVVRRLRSATATSTSDSETFHVVHSWGVLHHTGDMWRAIANAASLVRPNGHLILAIYARHWSSGIWKLIKWLYVHTPSLVQRVLIALLFPVIYAAKWMVTRRDPREQERGMDFYYDVVDWVGGYPYEYASTDDLAHGVEKLGFKTLKIVRATVPTGCNQFVFQRLPAVTRLDER